MVPGCIGRSGGICSGIWRWPTSDARSPTRVGAGTALRWRGLNRASPARLERPAPRTPADPVNAGTTRRVTHARIRGSDRGSQLLFLECVTRVAPHRGAGGTTVAMAISRRRSGLGGPLTGSVARSWTARHPHIDVVPEVERGVLCWGRALRSRGRGVVKPRRRRGAPPSTYGRRTETNRALTTRGSGRSARPFCVDPRSPLGYALALEVGVMIRSAGWLHAPRGTSARVRLEAP